MGDFQGFWKRISFMIKLAIIIFLSFKLSFIFHLVFMRNWFWFIFQCKRTII